ncbi:MAG: Ldh family oxidoreductase, partial [Verrucomicrobia bacterium]
MKGSAVRIGIDLLESFVYDVFRGMGVPANDARICTDVLLSADKR